MRSALNPMRGPRAATLRRLTLAAFALVAAAAPAGQAWAQDAMRIVAVVNDEMISGYDLEQRMRLVAGTGTLPSSSEQRQRLASQVLRSMIDERLQLQEAKRLNIRVEPKEIDDALARVAQQNNVALDQLPQRMKEEGLNIESLETQIEATIAWLKVVRRRGARFANVADDEVAETMARIKENASKPSHLLSQIFLSVDSPQDEGQVGNTARRLLEELRQGAPFNLLATQFSQDSHAREGGNLGWVQGGQLAPEIEAVVAQMPVGAVSTPIRSAEGYHIIALRDRRTPTTASLEDVQVSVQQIIVPIPANARADEVASQRTLAQTLSDTVNGCADMEKAAREMGTPASGATGLLRVGEMAAEIRNVVLALKVGEASKPLVGDGGARILMVCERKDPPSNLPTEQDVQRMLTEQKMEMQARRLLRDLRQTAFVDIRA